MEPFCDSRCRRRHSPHPSPLVVCGGKECGQSSSSQTAGPITGETLQAPSGDEASPAGQASLDPLTLPPDLDVIHKATGPNNAGSMSHDPLTLPPPLNVIHKATGPNNAGSLDDAAPNVQCPKRRAAPWLLPPIRGLAPRATPVLPRRTPPPTQWAFPPGRTKSSYWMSRRVIWRRPLVTPSWGGRTLRSCLGAMEESVTPTRSLKRRPTAICLLNSRPREKRSQTLSLLP